MFSETTVGVGPKGYSKRGLKVFRIYEKFENRLLEPTILPNVLF